MINPKPKPEISTLSNYKIFFILVIIPLMRSLITGLLIGLSVGVFAWILNREDMIDFGIILIILATLMTFGAWISEQKTAAKAGLSVAGLAGLMWLIPYITQADWQVKLAAAAGVLSSTVTWIPMLSRSIHMLEAWLGLDLDFDGVIGYPGQGAAGRTTTIRAEVKNKNSWLIANIETDPEKLLELAKDLKKNRSLSHSRFVGSNKLYSRLEWDQLIDQLEQRKLVVLRNPSARHLGFRLTDEGSALFEKIGRGVDEFQPPYQERIY